MKPGSIFLAAGLVVVLLASCAPQATPPLAVPAVESIPATVTAADISTPETTVVPPTQIVEVQAVATSRGPNLEATDPTTVSLASGQLQLIEFFRFT